MMASGGVGGAVGVGVDGGGGMDISSNHHGDGIYSSEAYYSYSRDTTAAPSLGGQSYNNNNRVNNTGMPYCNNNPYSIPQNNNNSSNNTAAAPRAAAALPSTTTTITRLIPASLPIPKPLYLEALDSLLTLFSRVCCNHTNCG